MTWAHVVEVEVVVVVTTGYVSLLVNHRRRILLKVAAYFLVAIGSVHIEHAVELNAYLIAPFGPRRREVEVIWVWCSTDFRIGDPLAVVAVVGSPRNGHY